MNKPEITTEQILDWLDDPSWYDDNPEYSADVKSAIRARLAEYDALKAEVEHRCDQRDAALESVGLLTKENERLRAEAERLKNESADAKLVSLYNLNRAEQAEAEVERLRFERDVLQSGAAMRMKAAEAELELARPLLVAVDAVDMGSLRYLAKIKYENGNTAHILKAALAYRKAKEGE